MSLALAGSERISDATRRRVTEIASQVGYRPHAGARSLRTDSTRAIGLIVSDVANPFFAELAGHIERTAAAEGYSVVLCNSDEDAKRQDGYLSSLLAGSQVDGVLLVPAEAMTPGIRAAGAAEANLVLLDRPIAVRGRGAAATRLRGCPVVRASAGDALTEVAALLTGLGHRRIGIIAPPLTTPVGRERRDLLVDALLARGTTPTLTCRGLRGCVPRRHPEPFGVVVGTGMSMLVEEVLDAACATATSPSGRARRLRRSRGGRHRRSRRPRSGASRSAGRRASRASSSSRPTCRVAPRSWPRRRGRVRREDRRLTQLRAPDGAPLREGAPSLSGPRLIRGGRPGAGGAPAPRSVAATAPRPVAELTRATRPCGRGRRTPDRRWRGQRRQCPTARRRGQPAGEGQARRQARPPPDPPGGGGDQPAPRRRSSRTPPRWRSPPRPLRYRRPPSTGRVGAAGRPRGAHTEGHAGRTPVTATPPSGRSTSRGTGEMTNDGKAERRPPPAPAPLPPAGRRRV